LLFGAEKWSGFQVREHGMETLIWKSVNKFSFLILSTQRKRIIILLNYNLLNFFPKRFTAFHPINISEHQYEISAASTTMYAQDISITDQLAQL